MLPALDSLFSSAARAGLSNIIVAMPHRGRLNLLTDPELLKYDSTALFYKIKGGSEWPEELIGEAGVEGDVLSHLSAYLIFFPHYTCTLIFYASILRPPQLPLELYQSFPSS